MENHKDKISFRKKRFLDLGVDYA